MVDIRPAGLEPRQGAGSGTEPYGGAGGGAVAADNPFAVLGDRQSVTRGLHACTEAMGTGAEDVAEARSPHGEVHGTGDVAMGPRGE